jgi:MYXO-CTERM domain-containing protein
MHTLELSQHRPKQAARRTRSLALVAVTFSLASAWSSVAVASQHYPIWLGEYFMAPVPQCIVCHTTNAGGDGTTGGIPYAATLEAKGLVGKMAAGDEAQKQAFFALVGANSNGDSDGDGASDKDELTLQGNPSDPSIGPGGGVIEPYEYGCVGSKDKPGSSPESSGTSPMMSSAPPAMSTPPMMSNAAPASSSVAGAGSSRSPALWLMIAAAALVIRRRATR